MSETPPDPADVHTGTHDHTGPDSACPACKPLADVLRDRMRWPSMHWGELHPDAYASLARAVHAAGYQLPVHTVTDRVELTDDEVRILGAASDGVSPRKEPGDWRYSFPHDDLLAAIGSIVAARLQALTVERDELRERIATLEEYLNER